MGMCELLRHRRTGCAIFAPPRMDAYLEWNLVRLPDWSASASFVSMSSASMCATRTTMSSQLHSSYFWGSTLTGAGAWRCRFGALDDSASSVSRAAVTRARSFEACDFRRLPGERTLVVPSSRDVGATTLGCGGCCTAGSDGAGGTAI